MLKIICVGCLAGVLTLPVRAQRSEDDSVKTEAASNNLKSKLSSPYGASALSNFISNINVSSYFKEGVNGKVELAGDFKKGWTGGLSIDQKIGKGLNSSMPVSLTGISPGTTLSIHITKMLGWHPTFIASDEEIGIRMQAIDAYAKRNNIADPRTIGLREISINGTAEEKKMALQSFKNVRFNEPFFVDLKAGFTKQSFDFTTDSFNLSTNHDAFITPNMSLSFVKVIGSGFNVAGYFAVNYQYSEYYTSQDELTFSLPFGNTGNFFTSSVIFGTPVKQTSHALSAEFRRNIYLVKQTGDSSNLAISPSATYAFGSKMLGFFLPVYFIKGANDSGKLLDVLQGGVRLSYFTYTGAGRWQSFGKGFMAQLIVSAPLDFLNVL